MPEEYAIYQPLAVTTGPGGIVRCLRCLLMFCGFSLGTKEYCPKVWVINFTNPMSAFVKTLCVDFVGKQLSYLVKSIKIKFCKERK